MLQILDNKNIKMSELCSYLGINTSTMANWKTRNTDPPAKYIIPICEYLNVSPEYILTGKDLSKKTTIIDLPSTQLTENEMEIIELFKKLTERQQLKLIVKAEDMVEENQKNNSQENVG